MASPANPKLKDKTKTSSSRKIQIMAWWPHLPLAPKIPCQLNGNGHQSLHPGGIRIEMSNLDSCGRGSQAPTFLCEVQPQPLPAVVYFFQVCAPFSIENAKFSPFEPILALFYFKKLFFCVIIHTCSQLHFELCRLQIYNITLNGVDCKRSKSRWAAKLSKSTMSS